MKAVRSASMAAAVGLALATPVASSAQHEGPDAAGHVALLSANAMAGAVGAGVAAWVRGEDVSRAFLLGAAGGSLGYVGKVTATSDFTGAPIAGRQLAAVGHGMIGNAAEGRGALSHVWLPASPFRLKLPDEERGWRLQLDLMDLTMLLYGVLTPELDFDAGLALRQGTPVFVATDRAIHVKDHGYVGGFALSGTIVVSGAVPAGSHRRSLLAHEMVHIIQNDFAKVAISYPVERWAVRLLAPEWNAEGPVQGGFSAAAADLALGGLGNDGWIRQVVEGEARALVRPYRFAPTGR